MTGQSYIENHFPRMKWAIKGGKCVAIDQRFFNINKCATGRMKDSPQRKQKEVFEIATALRECDSLYVKEEGAKQ